MRAKQHANSLIRERTLSGVRLAKANGKTLGRPMRIFRRDDVVRLREEGVSWRAIRKATRVSIDVDSLNCTEIVPRKGPVSDGKTKPETVAA
jgi:DNA invertase Pin-like site-specific DNA recombinase